MGSGCKQHAGSTALPQFNGAKCDGVANSQGRVREPDPEPGLEEPAIAQHFAALVGRHVREEVEDVGPFPVPWVDDRPVCSSEKHQRKNMVSGWQVAEGRGTGGTADVGSTRLMVPNQQPLTRQSRALEEAYVCEKVCGREK